VHHYILTITNPDHHNRINQVLIGPLTSDRPLVDERAGFTPPAWWKGDEYASRSGVAAMMTLKR
jgi:hypothetical protein